MENLKIYIEGYNKIFDIEAIDFKGEVICKGTPSLIINYNEGCEIIDNNMIILKPIGIRSINNDLIYDYDIVEFTIYNNQKPIKLIGYFLYNPDELRYEISLLGNNNGFDESIYFDFETMSNFRVVGNYLIKKYLW